MARKLNIKSKTFIFYLLLVILIIVLITNHKDIITIYKIFFVFQSPCDGKLFLDNKNNKLSPLFWERPEQYYIIKYVEPDDCVIELGGRYGVSSYCIQNKLKNKELHLIIEPDKSIITTLHKNIKNNSMQSTVFNGLISKNNKCLKQQGLGTFSYNCKKSNIEIKSIYDVELGCRFNTMVIDCEGCFIDVFKDFKNYILQNITKIIIETDKNIYMSTYNEIFEVLINNNFKIVDKFFNHIYILKKE
jgi:FkbM family methyltransferase